MSRPSWREQRAYDEAFERHQNLIDALGPDNLADTISALQLRIADQKATPVRQAALSALGPLVTAALPQLAAQAIVIARGELLDARSALIEAIGEDLQ